jgi:hypothetical protein
LIAVWTFQVSGADLQFRVFVFSRLTPFVSCRRDETEPDWLADMILDLTMLLPNTSLEPTGVGAVSSAARFTSQFAGGSVLGR